MAYLVLARKYRPQTFREVIGQQHITTTLKNSISLERVAHSFLFSGPRGVGKTTTARILAKSLNCQKVTQGEPCNTCDSCRDITGGHCVDVLEIDGASNNSVDDIRDLRDKIRYLPTVSQYKIYIIDEVHMLSTAAFNALLKTLEEPPPHAVFIFATTEPHKIPATIVSRCQRYDFKRVSINEIVETLQNLVNNEKRCISSQVLRLIAQSADGSLRDAQSILEQIISSSEGQIEYDDVRFLLGVVKENQIYSIWQSIFEQKPGEIFSGIAKIIDRGYDLYHFSEQLLYHLRNLIVYKSCKDHESLLDISQEEKKILQNQGEGVSPEDLQQYFSLLSQCMDQMKGSSHAQVILEMTLVQLAQMRSVITLSAILQRLSELEKFIQEKQPILSEAPNPKYSETPNPTHSTHPEAPIPAQPPKQPCLENQSSSESTPADPSFDKLASAPATMDSTSSLSQNWGKVLQEIKKEKKTLLPILQKATFTLKEDTTIALSYSENQSFYYDTVNQKQNQLLLQKWIARIFGEQYRVEYCKVKETISGPSVIQPKKREDYEDRNIDGIMKRYPIVKEAMETFSAKLTQSHVSFRQKE